MPQVWGWGSACGDKTPYGRLEILRYRTLTHEDRLAENYERHSELVIGMDRFESLKEGVIFRLVNIVLLYSKGIAASERVNQAIDVRAFRTVP